MIYNDVADMISLRVLKHTANSSKKCIASAGLSGYTSSFALTFFFSG